MSAAPICWQPVCRPMKASIDRMHPMLPLGQDHCLPDKHLVFITAYSAEDRYGSDLAVKMLESITG